MCIRGLYAKVHETRHTCRATSVRNKDFFQNYNILPRSGVRAESLQLGSENMPNFVTFWPTL